MAGDDMGAAWARHVMCESAFNMLFLGWSVEVCENSVFADPSSDRYPMVVLRTAGPGRRSF